VGAIESIQKMAWIAWTMMIDGRSCPPVGSSPPVHGPSTVMMLIQLSLLSLLRCHSTLNCHCKEKKSCIRLNISESIILCLSSNSPDLSSASFEYAVSYKTRSKDMPVVNPACANWAPESVHIIPSNMLTAISPS